MTDHPDPDMTDDDAAEANLWYERKSQAMVEVLGAEHEMVMHAIIPYGLGGGLDLYYYPNGIEGTGIATKELSEVPGEGSSNDVYQNYELVMFTRAAIDLDRVDDDETPFGRAHATINAVLNCMAPYSEEAILNPHETCEFPADMENVGGKCLIMDGYTPYDSDQPAEFGLLLLMEVFRSEMEYARENGGAALLERLKLAGHYPYSDLDRDPVV